MLFKDLLSRTRRVTREQRKTAVEKLVQRKNELKQKLNKTLEQVYVERERVCRIESAWRSDRNRIISEAERAREHRRRLQSKLSFSTMVTTRVICSKSFKKDICRFFPVCRKQFSSSRRQIVRLDRNIFNTQRNISSRFAWFY